MNSPSFQPDLFQQKAIQALNEGASVLVAAPTGSGKTYIAEHAISEALKKGMKSFYTAPIKALSNQKFHDFQELYGSENVGLLTGDTSINSDAKILVMTTEVLRNMIYASSRSLENLSVVILDEVHFLQDQYRGPVWEEVIIHLPLEVTLVCLSATVSNAVEVSEWLTTVRGDTRAIIETKRPVNLEHHHMAFDKATGDTVMYPTLVENQMNPRAKKAFAVQDHKHGDSSRNNNQNKKSRHTSESRFGPPNRNEVVKHWQMQICCQLYFSYLAVINATTRRVECGAVHSLSQPKMNLSRSEKLHRTALRLFLQTRKTLSTSKDFYR